MVKAGGNADARGQGFTGIRVGVKLVRSSPRSQIPLQEGIPEILPLAAEGESPRIQIPLEGESPAGVVLFAEDEPFWDELCARGKHCGNVQGQKRRDSNQLRKGSGEESSGTNELKRNVQGKETESNSIGKGTDSNRDNKLGMTSSAAIKKGQAGEKVIIFKGRSSKGSPLASDASLGPTKSAGKPGQTSSVPAVPGSSLRSTSASLDGAPVSGSVEGREKGSDVRGRDGAKSLEVLSICEVEIGRSTVVPLAWDRQRNAIQRLRHRSAGDTEDRRDSLNSKQRPEQGRVGSSRVQGLNEKQRGGGDEGAQEVGANGGDALVAVQRACRMGVSSVRSQSAKICSWLEKGVQEPCSRIITRTFIPADVAPSYIPYMRWKVCQRAVSSFLHALATQALLRALGLGGRQSVAAASAGVQWVLKDGVGKLGRLVYMGAYGHTFDCHLKRSRFTTSALFTLSLGLDMLTSVFPSRFLLLATAANVGKSIGLATYLATTPAIHKSFALGENLADISAKGQAQSVVADNVGLALALAVGLAGQPKKPSRMLLRFVPAILYPVLATLDLLCISKELRSVPLRTLNQERLEMVADTWLKHGTAPSLLEVSRAERLFIPPDWGRAIPLRVGSLSLHTSAHPDLPRRISGILIPSAQPWVISICGRSNPRTSTAAFDLQRANWLQKLSGPTLALSFRADASPIDKILGIFQACILRQSLLEARGHNKQTQPNSQGLKVHSTAWESVLVDDSLAFEVIQRSEQIAHSSFAIFVKDVGEQGWQTNRIQLIPNCSYMSSTFEKALPSCSAPS